MLIRVIENDIFSEGQQGWIIWSANIKKMGATSVHT